MPNFSVEPTGAANKVSVLARRGGLKVRWGGLA